MAWLPFQKFQTKDKQKENIGIDGLEKPRLRTQRRIAKIQKVRNMDIKTNINGSNFKIENRGPFHKRFHAGVFSNLGVKTPA